MVLFSFYRQENKLCVWMPLLPLTIMTHNVSLGCNPIEHESESSKYAYCMFVSQQIESMRGSSFGNFQFVLNKECTLQLCHADTIRFFFALPPAAKWVVELCEYPHSEAPSLLCSPSQRAFHAIHTSINRISFSHITFPLLPVLGRRRRRWWHCDPPSIQPTDRYVEGSK